MSQTGMKQSDADAILTGIRQLSSESAQKLAVWTIMSETAFNKYGHPQTDLAT